MNNNDNPTYHYNAYEEISGAALCVGYVSGVTDSFNGALFCVPSNSTAEQLTRVTAKYLNTHPEKLNLNLVQLVVYALQQTFPCQKAN